MMRSITKLGAAALLALGLGTGVAAASEGGAIPHESWSFSGAFGTFDRAALQRGYQVYKEVCAACHSMQYIAFRNLTDIGFSEAEVKALAAQYEYPALDESGEPITRKGLPSDHFVSPYANELAAKAANGGAIPPDLSLMAKARAGGPDYIHAILTGYVEPPQGFVLNPGSNFNAHFPGQQIAMPKPLNDDQVTYADGTKATVEQMSRDVSTFLMWTAEPKLEERKNIGVKVMGFLGILTVFLYLSYRRVRRKVHGH
ncbi:cytochrome c1 [Oleomonas cavernae]|uniref:Cytochrome c1 n=1 Tax=Oleomonas cavernae TaxID=2320859 RepID=A0A418WD33_9PROT|nr:cytochrome c1 [Oleomonas cavernae]RJF87869.1 cytochrome c1 [Oleomonas cavernae]